MAVAPDEVLRRLEYVERLYLRGRTRRAIQDLASKRFGITHRAVRRYLARVGERLAALPKPSPAAAKARAESLLLRAYLAAERGGEKGPQAAAMVQAAARLAELDGVLAKHHEVTGRDGGPVETVARARVIVLPELEPEDPADAAK